MKGNWRPGVVADVTFKPDGQRESETMRGIRWTYGWIVSGESGYEVVHDRVVEAVRHQALLTDIVEMRPCEGRNVNVCVAEGCDGEACRTAEPVGRGDAADVKAGRCCPFCRAFLTEHNKAIWDGGYGVGTRHGQQLPTAADALREVRQRIKGARILDGEGSIFLHVIDQYINEVDR